LTEHESEIGVLQGQINNSNEFTDQYKADCDSISYLWSDQAIIKTDIITNTNNITSNTTEIASLSNQIRLPYITTISVTVGDMINSTSYPVQGNRSVYEHNFNIGKALYDNYGMSTEFYPDGEWRSHKTFEVGFQGRFHINNGTLYQLQTGFRNLKVSDNSESTTTSYMLDAGARLHGQDTNIVTLRYNTGTQYITTNSNSHLYGQYYFYLHTRLDFTPETFAAIDLVGVITIKSY
jgi:hypothetical protein